MKDLQTHVHMVFLNVSNNDVLNILHTQLTSCIFYTGPNMSDFEIQSSCNRYTRGPIKIKQNEYISGSTRSILSTKNCTSDAYFVIAFTCRISEKLPLLF